eukprot:CAMPEP_0114557216 /NCGR_PEP_ID=MMETSP0114-20121206/9710_1 /TAXON_ID=31324 /ORGANISM="Goniomonas sp, Strain m" /LENGTH=621 /DNA_ID=CAMNT_0001742485 /DNA_START=20 /DNA_END=1885 /DNA_ORIENTATION=-
MPPMPVWRYLACIFFACTAWWLPGIAADSNVERGLPAELHDWGRVRSLDVTSAKSLKVLRVAEMVQAEARANAAGHTFERMMHMAGIAVAEVVLSQGNVSNKEVLVLVGTGNNGGDALVAARELGSAGAHVSLWLTRARDPRVDKVYAETVAALGHDGKVAVVDEGLTQDVLRAQIIIDGILGTAVVGPVRGSAAATLHAVRQGLQAPGHQQPTIIAVDIPSGINPDTAEPDLLTLPASITVTFGAVKRGHLEGHVAHLCGEVLVADIGLREEDTTGHNVSVITAAVAKSLLPHRPLWGHKGTFGSVLVAGGCTEFPGAPTLAARGAYRAGAGLVAVAVPPLVRTTAPIALPEAVYPDGDDAQCFTQRGDGCGSLSHTMASVLWPEPASAGRTYKAVLLGPGLGSKASLFVTAALQRLRKQRAHALRKEDDRHETEGTPGHCDASGPSCTRKGKGLRGIVVDADALTSLASSSPDWWHQLPSGSVLTPHPGEMAKMLRVPVGDVIAQDTHLLAPRCAREWKAVVVLKGAFTVIAAPDGRVGVLPFASPALGVAGTGDVLGGAIASLLAQGLPAYEAACLGAFLHAAGATSVARAMGSVDGGVLASEVADTLPRIRAALLRL